MNIAKKYLENKTPFEVLQIRKDAIYIRDISEQLSINWCTGVEWLILCDYWRMEQESQMNKLLKEANKIITNE